MTTAPGRQAGLGVWMAVWATRATGRSPASRRASSSTKRWPLRSHSLVTSARQETSSPSWTSPRCWTSEPTWIHGPSRTDRDRTALASRSSQPGWATPACVEGQRLPHVPQVPDGGVGGEAVRRQAEDGASGERVGSGRRALLPLRRVGERPRRGVGRRHRLVGQRRSSGGAHVAGGIEHLERQTALAVVGRDHPDRVAVVGGLQEPGLHPAALQPGEAPPLSARMGEVGVDVDPWDKPATEPVAPGHVVVVHGVLGAGGGVVGHDLVGGHRAIVARPPAQPGTR